MTTLTSPSGLVRPGAPDQNNGHVFLPEKAPWKRALNNFGMRSAGRLAVGLNSILGSRAGGLVGILMYHRVARHTPGLPAPLHNVRPEAFEQQLRGLLARGFKFVPVRRLLQHHTDGDAPAARTVAVTFDDGFQSVYTHAWPVLRELQIPATVFVNTAYLDNETPLPFDAWGVKYCRRTPAESFRPLTTEQCREMAAEGLIDIGAHTHTHADMRGRPDVFRRDVQKSVDIVAERFAPPCMMFAFPYGGRHNGFAGDELVEAARQTGVACGLTTACTLVDPRHDPFRWGRFNVFAWDSSRTLAAKLAGWYGWAPHLRQRLAGQLPPEHATSGVPE